MPSLLLVLSVLIAAPLPEGAASSLDLSSTKTRWHTLPAEVQNVRLASDGRIWYQLRASNLGHRSLASVKEDLAREFRQPSPKARGVLIALFEPGGRVWFFLRDKNLLLGYDGKTWIEYAVPGRDNAVCGECMSRGEFSLSHANRWADHRCWFITARSVLSFDGTKWSRDDFFDLQKDWSSRCLALSPSGKTAVAYSYSLESFRVWRAGQWKPVPLPPLDSSAPVILLDMSDDRTLWFVRKEGQMERLDIGNEADKPDPAADEIAERVKVVRRIYQDAAGRMYLLAEDIRDEKSSRSGAGLAVIVGGKIDKILFNQELTAHRQHCYLGESLPHFCADGRRVWWPMCDPGPAGRLLDMDRGDLGERLPLPAPTWIRAVGGDGRVFLGENWTYLDSTSLVRVFNPGVRDDRIPLKVDTTDVQLRNLVVADDGAIWTVQKRRGLVRFDGAKWTPVGHHTAGDSADTAPQIRTMLPGKGGRMLVRTDDHDAIYDGDKEIARGPITDIIEQHPDVIRQTFTPDRGAPTNMNPVNAAFSIIADKAGNIWYLENHRLQVYVRDHWVSANEPLTSAGSPHGSAQYLTAVGDGSKVYVSNLAMYYQGGCSFLGCVKDGDLDFAKAPHVTGYESMAHVLRAADGSLWLPVRIGVGHGTCDYYSGQVACCISEKGVDQELRNTGWSQLVDEAGNVWLGHIPGMPVDVFRVWRRGKVVQELAIPQSQLGLLFSDRSGSVYVRTRTGLHHYTADGPRFHPYHLAKTYSFDDMMGPPIAQAYSKLGYLLLLTKSNSPRSTSLHLVHLPK